MEKIELDILSNGMDGEGIAKVDGKVFFVDGAIEGETVLAEVVKQNKNFSTANTVKVLNSSNFRCNPKCKHYGNCGGCNMQHILYQKSLDIKTCNVQTLFNKNKLSACVQPTEKSENQYAYRNKLTMYLSKNRKLGFFKKKSNTLVEIDKCELVGTSFNKLIDVLNKFFKNNLEFTPLVLKGVAIREVNGVFVLNLILSKKMNLSTLQNFLKLNKINFSLYYCINQNSKSILPTYPVFFAGGEQNVENVEFEIKHNIKPMAFMQVNGNVKHKLYSHVFDLITQNSVVLDAYSGMGVLSAMISKKAKKVFAVEIDKMACDCCEEICKANNIKNLKVYCGDCSSVVPKIMETEKIDIAVLDPARKGVDGNTLNAIINAKPTKIVYISCNVATLTRDLKIIIDSGLYKINFVKPYDMFPNTSEVETLVELEIK